jgi:hypothetical protein
MHKLVKQKVAWIWIAALAILFSALAPTISHAMAAAAPLDEAVQVCTMEGMKTIVVANGPAGKFDPHRFEHFLEHCPYCAVHAGPALLPEPAQPAFAAPLAGAFHPPLFYQSAAPLFAWTAASPRGPPPSA